jgi:hypothetical protein
MTKIRVVNVEVGRDTLFGFQFNWSILCRRPTRAVTFSLHKVKLKFKYPCYREHRIRKHLYVSYIDP